MGDRQIQVVLQMTFRGPERDEDGTYTPQEIAKELMESFEDILPTNEGVVWSKVEIQSAGYVE